MTKTKAEKDQSRRFIEAARELGCDDDPKAFERVFSKIVPPKTGTSSPKPKRSGRQGRTS